MQPNIHLRPARSSDWPEISRLLTLAHLPLEGAEENLSGFFVAFHGAELIGSACLGFVNK